MTPFEEVNETAPSEASNSNVCVKFSRALFCRDKNSNALGISLFEGELSSSLQLIKKSEEAKRLKNSLHFLLKDNKFLALC